ncbi:unnamed protein product, partial [Polarella glacialis]
IPPSKSDIAAGATYTYLAVIGVVGFLVPRLLGERVLTSLILLVTLSFLFTNGYRLCYLFGGVEVDQGSDAKLLLCMMISMAVYWTFNCVRCCIAWVPSVILPIAYASWTFTLPLSGPEPEIGDRVLLTLLPAYPLQSR